jgi:hypothetical protein
MLSDVEGCLKAMTQAASFSELLKPRRLYYLIVLTGRPEPV